MIALRWKRRARAATSAYRGRLAERLDRVSQDMEYESLRERAADELEVLEVLWEEKANDAAHALLAGSMGWLPDVNERIAWSVKVPERPALVVVPEDGAA